MDVTPFYKITGLILFAYFLGSIPWGLVLTRLFTDVDITTQGSGNIGATNVKRVAGFRWGVLTLAGDVFKGAVPVYLAFSLVGTESPYGQLAVSGVALAAFLGHLYPVYLKFKTGGKGVATTFGCFLVISPWACLVSLVVFIMVVGFSGRVSAGSLTASLVLAPSVWIMSHSPFFSGCALVFFVMIFWRHQENIRRLVNGREPRIW